MTEVIAFPGKPEGKVYGKSPAMAALPEVQAANAKPKPRARTKVRMISAMPPGGHTKVEVKNLKHPAVRDVINRIGDWLMHLDTERDALSDEEAKRLEHHLEVVEASLAGTTFLLGPTKPMGGKRA